MFDRTEQNFFRLFEQLHLLLASPIDPELRRITDDRDRGWALWYALSDTPGWARAFVGVTILLVGPACVLILLRIAGVLPAPVNELAIVTWLGAWGFGACGTTAAVERIRLPRVRRRLYRAMRILGHDVCHRCGFQMDGHADAIIRRCPECGDIVQRLKG